MENEQNTLESDHQRRVDLSTLKKGAVDAAQKNKEMLENIQRNDKKLRDEYKKMSKKKG